MKKITLIVASLVMATSVFAQGEFKYGVKAGMNIGTLTNTKDWGGDLDRRAKTGIYLGAVAEYRFTDLIGMQAEAVYSRQGVTWSGKDGDVMEREGYRFNYINIPVLVKFYPIEKLSIDFGPQFGFVVGAAYYFKEIDKHGGSDGKRFAIKGNDKLSSTYYNVFDISLGLGVNYAIIDMLELNVRYNFGLTNVMDKDFYGENTKNRVLQVGATVKF